MKIYKYYSPFGMLNIRETAFEHRPWLLFIDSKIISKWPTADAAAEAVRTQRTGLELWDSLPPVSHPTTLDDWLLSDSPY
jgi:hypothetical protein